jgi:hypothetical protein
MEDEKEISLGSLVSISCYSKNNTIVIEKAYKEYIHRVVKHAYTKAVMKDEIVERLFPV